MKIIHANIFELAANDDIDVIVHGCNCFNIMGAGIAKEIARLFPDAYQADQATRRGDPRKLGHITTASCPAPMWENYIPNSRLVPGKPYFRGRETACRTLVINAYTQFSYGPDKKGNMPFSANSMIDAMERTVISLIKREAKTPRPLRIASPLIGAGLAGGDPELCKEILSCAFEEMDYTLVLLPEKNGAPHA